MDDISAVERFYDQAGQLAAEHSAEDASRIRLLATRLVSLRTRVIEVRNPSAGAPWPNMFPILRELVLAGYHHEQDEWFPKAERRLLYEDWAFKTPKHMTLPDMYGGGIPPDTTPVIPVSRHQAIVREEARRSYETGYADGYRKGKNSRTPDEQRQDEEAKRDILEALRDTERRDAELEQARREISRLRNIVSAQRDRP